MALALTPARRPRHPVHEVRAVNLYLYYGAWLVIIACTVGLAWFAAKREWKAFGGVALVLVALFATITYNAAVNGQLG